MEYFDLNLRPVELSHQEKIDAVCNLINNAISQYHNQEYTTKLIVDYDETTNTLRIKDNGTGINLSDFVEQESVNGWFTRGLRTAISGLIANQITPIFKSNFGTFTPIIRNKDGLSQKIASLFIAYEPKVTAKDTWTDLKDIDNKDTLDHGTQVTISPLTSEFVTTLKTNFSFLLPWTKEIKTKYGYFLIGKQETINNVFVDGQNVSYMHAPKPDDKDQEQLTFSYDINASEFDPDLIQDPNDNPGRYAYDCISAIYDELDGKDKECVFTKLLNNHDSFEWNSWIIRRQIIKYFGKTNPDKYLIGLWDDENPNYVEFAKLANKQIIWIDNTEEFDDLSKLGIQPVNQFGSLYAEQNYTNYVSINKLTAHERTNWETFQLFLTYFANSNKKIQDGMAKHELDHYEIKIIESLPTKEGFFNYDEECGVINRKILGDSFANLLNKCELIIYFETRNRDLDYDSFDKLWNDSIANFIIASNKNSTKEALN